MKHDFSRTGLFPDRKKKLDKMSAIGIPTEIHSYPRLRHGFGVGTGTVAEGWVDEAVTFWEAQSEDV